MLKQRKIIFVSILIIISIVFLLMMYKDNKKHGDKIRNDLKESYWEFQTYYSGGEKFDFFPVVNGEKENNRYILEFKEDKELIIYLHDFSRGDTLIDIKQILYPSHKEVFSWEVGNRPNLGNFVPNLNQFELVISGLKYTGSIKYYDSYNLIIKADVSRDQFDFLFCLRRLPNKKYIKIFNNSGFGNDIFIEELIL